MINRYLDLPDICIDHAAPIPVSRPEYVIFNHELADQLGISQSDFLGQDTLNILSGNRILPGSTPLALAYAGHQFGHFNPRLGDGRAHVLGQLSDASGELWDIQLKGSGRTRFSRNGDGRSALGPAIREYIVSEAMHALGIPSTRCLAVISTGDTVLRQTGEHPGGISVRVAQSHLRIGTFQYVATHGKRNDIQDLLDFLLTHHYPHILNKKAPALEFFETLIKKAAALVSQWMSVGFIHGVMNTDNISVLADTIDYGPCAFLDEADPQKVFSSIDQWGRYAYANQAPIMAWNLEQLGHVLQQLFDQDKQTNLQFNLALSKFSDHYTHYMTCAFSEKLGLRSKDSESETVIQEYLKTLTQNKKDFTQAFDQFSQEHGIGKNPVYIPRNHHIERIINDAEIHQRYDTLHEMMTVLKTPYTRQEGMELFEAAPTEEEKVQETFCGT